MATTNIDSITAQDDMEFHSLFPYRLHQVLSMAERHGLEHVVSWLPCGTAFKVHDIKAFERSVMPKIGRLSRYKSFQRQLNMYKFKRIALNGYSKAGAYQHPYFRRSHPELCRAVLRGELYGGGSDRREGEVLNEPATVSSYGKTRTTHDIGIRKAPTDGSCANMRFSVTSNATNNFLEESLACLLSTTDSSSTRYLGTQDLAPFPSPEAPQGSLGDILDEIVATFAWDAPAY